MARVNGRLEREGSASWVWRESPGAVLLLRQKAHVPETVDPIDFDQSPSSGGAPDEGPGGSAGPSTSKGDTLEGAARSLLASGNPNMVPQGSRDLSSGGEGGQGWAGRPTLLDAPPRKRLKKAADLAPAAAGTAAAEPNQQQGQAGGAAAPAAAAGGALRQSGGSLGGDASLTGEDRDGSVAGAERGHEDESSEDDEYQPVQDYQEPNDTQCGLCDDGGDLISCDGPCMRAFHFGYRKEEGEEGEPDVEVWLEPGDQGYCNPLAIPRDLGQLLITPGNSDTFLCPNCLAGRHQCFQCKAEGDAGRDVFRCRSAACGKFYHQKCVGGKEDGGDIFCALHTCRNCKECGGSAVGPKGELVPCRRCPKAYHRKCLPAGLLNAPVRRVWLSSLDEEGRPTEDTEVTHSLIYCKKHKVDPQTLAVAHERPLFEQGLLASWRRHYAGLYPHLQSSAALLAAEAKRTQRAEAEEEGSDLEDVPLAKRAKLVASFQRPPSSAGLRSPLGSPAKPGPLAAAPSPPKPAALAAAKAGPGAGTHAAQGEAPTAAAAAVAAGPGAAGVGAGAAAGEGLSGGGEEAEAAAAAAAAEEVLPLPPPLSAREARKAAEAQLREVERLVTLDALRRETRQPRPYDGPLKKTIEQDRLASLEDSLRYAERYALERGGAVNPSALSMLVDRNSTNEVYQRHDDLMLALAPYMHGDRYTSYGRHFTDPRVLEYVVDRMAEFMRDGDQVVDFSCGANEWVPRVRRRCLEEGLVVKGAAYDIILAKDLQDFRLKSWFDTYPETENLAQGDNLVIGLNPPFGKNNQLADKFVDRAVKFRPRLIVLIVPPDTRVPRDYAVIHENRTVCGHEVFYVPGSNKRSWNKEFPAVRIMVRRDMYQETITLSNRRDWVEIPFDAPQYGGAAAQQQAQQAQQHAMMAGAGVMVQQHPLQGMAGDLMGDMGFGMGYGGGFLMPQQAQHAMLAQQQQQQQHYYAAGGLGMLDGGPGGSGGYGSSELPPGFGGEERPLWPQDARGDGGGGGRGGAVARGRPGRASPNFKRGRGRGGR